MENIDQNLMMDEFLEPITTQYRILTHERYTAVENIDQNLMMDEFLEPITTQHRILTHERYTAVENIARKGEIACSKQFLLFSPCLLPYMVLIFHFKFTLQCMPWVIEFLHLH